MTDWAKRVFWGALIGAALGVLVGLGLGRLLWPPVEPAPAETPAPTATVVPTTAEATATPVPAQPSASPAAKGDGGEDLDGALVVISALYALDGDLARAEERLGALALDDPAQAVADLALRHASAGNGQLATDLATLAAALGAGQSELLAYVATATHTATPTITPSSTPTPTETPSPTPTATPTPPPAPTRAPTRRPTAAPAPTSAPPPAAATSLPWDWWDHRVDLLEPPVKLVEAQVAPGEWYWRLVRLEWWKAGEGGNTMIYISTLDANGGQKWGQPVVIENGGRTVLYTDPKPGEAYGANMPMSGTLNSYLAYVGGDLPSDRVTGMGLGEYLGGLDHTTFVLIFQLTRK